MNTINQLPDDAMLSHIISSISIDEAVRSSILSNRWKPLWKHASCLDFDVSPMIKSLYQFENSSSRVVNFDQIKSTQQHAHRYVDLNTRYLITALDTLPPPLYCRDEKNYLKRLTTVFWTPRRCAKGLSIFAPDLIRSWLPDYVPTYSYMV
ncbi:hypothetical protein glysoja_049734 [Glycine soja]|uniref:F-box domain-containing protein n=1 Tax=Glycine soja TaxID=3848 RepID=A0A0B2REP7_GLYSO|nr:hypothetical protein glysoja_049734 [Glycine soja]